MRNRERIRPGLGKDQQRQAEATVHEGGRPIIGGADLDTANVTEARTRPSLSDLMRILANCSGVESLPSVCYIEPERLTRRGRRRLVQNAGRHLDVLRAHRRENLAPIQVAGSDLVRISESAWRGHGPRCTSP